jgi:glycerate kinase
MALAGSIGPGAEAVLEQEIDAYFWICTGPMSLDDALIQAGDLLARATEQAVRAFRAGQGRQFVSGSSSIGT